MMNSATNQALEVVETKLMGLLERATNRTIRAKLGNLHEVCRHLVMNGRQRLTVPSVLAAYAAKFHSQDQSLAESSIRNKRGGANPYQELYRAWESAAEVIIRSRRTPRTALNEIIGPGDISVISDPVTRHQVALLIAQNRSYKNQLDILKKVRGAPVVQLIGSSRIDPLPLDNDLALNEAEVEAIRDFLAAGKLRTLRFRRTSDGGIATTDGRRLADPGFMEALEKILRSYQNPA